MMNEKEHWNKIAPSYNDEIFDVFQNDKFRKLSTYFKKHGSLSKTAIDFGCGNGKSFPFIAPLFKQVIAFDISKGLLKQAEQRGFTNVTLKQADLTKKKLVLPKVDFAFCCNVIMFPVRKKNCQMIDNVYRSLKPGGIAVIVLPSLDSALFAAWRMMDVYEKEGTKPQDIPKNEFDYFKANKRDLIQGIIHIDGVPTKHYSESEIKVMFREAGFTVTAIDKLEYDWETEIALPPKWLKDPYPWDWLVELRK
ncbi:MAG: class I SAM-dependent methyltransferase [Cyclobacteriaceae bacterium]|nr:class I SAM-dependent methyltransferase [Cyclobacteriaceae bacterium]